MPSKLSSDISISEIYMIKFVNRKDKIQSQQALKYIRSKSPEILLNPNF